jgi:hypothetical protein
MSHHGPFVALKLKSFFVAVKLVVLCFAVKLNNALAIKAGFAVKEYLLPGVADNDNCVFFAII